MVEALQLLRTGASVEASRTRRFDAVEKEKMDEELRVVWVLDVGFKDFGLKV